MKLADHADIDPLVVDPFYTNYLHPKYDCENVVDLEIDNLILFMEILGVYDISPIKFYKFIRILMQDIDLPTQVEDPNSKHYYATTSN